jgi:hypothetical protein
MTKARKPTAQVIQFPPTLNFGPAFDDATMAAMENAAQSLPRGQQRRCALIALARDRATLLKMAVESPDAFTNFAGAVEAFRVNAQASLKLAESACARIEIVRMTKEASHG